MSTYPRRSVLYIGLASASIVAMAVMSVNPAAAELSQYTHSNGRDWRSFGSPAQLRMSKLRGYRRFRADSGHVRA
jgi:hypothetical protein